MQQSSHIYSDSQTVNMSRCRFSLGNDRFIEVTEWKGELRDVCVCVCVCGCVWVVVVVVGGGGGGDSGWW